jgi:hypothetical protein
MPTSIVEMSDLPPPQPCTPTPQPGDMSQNAPLGVPYLGNSLQKWKRKLHHF